jgi:ankyrin repeat protein
MEKRNERLLVGLGVLWIALVALIAWAAPAPVVKAPAPGLTLAAAAQAGDDDTVAALLARRADVNAPGADGSAALHWAVDREDVAMTERLIKAGADVNLKTLFGMTPLMLAAMDGNPEIIRRLLDAGADVKATLSHGETALMLAARNGKREAVELLIARGADVNAKEKLRGTTALMWAASNHNTNAVRALLAHGADVAAKSGVGPMGRGPYLSPPAISRIKAYQIGYGKEGQKPGVTEMERLRARASFVDEAASKKLAELARQGDKQAAVPVFNDDGEVADATPSAAAAQTQAPPSAVQAPAATSRRAFPAPASGGLTALVMAAREGDAETARALLDAGADINQTTDGGWTPLLAAVQNRSYRLAKEFLDRGADPKIANKGGWTPLYIAVDNRNIEGGDYPTRKPDMDHLQMIRLLLEHGADVNARMASSTETRTVFTNQWLDENGATPFLRAAQSGDMELLRLLLSYGADPNIATKGGVTPLMVASGIAWVEGITYEWSPEQNLETVKLLLQLGADVNAHDTIDLRTALMGAAHKGRNDVVQLLVDHGADLDAHDVGSRDSVHRLYGRTWRAIDYADGLVRIGVQSAIAHPETAALLRKMMKEKGLKVPPEGRTLDSICIVEVCQPPAD